MLSRNASKSEPYWSFSSFSNVMYYKNMNEPTTWGQDYYCSPTADSRSIREEFLDYGANGDRDPHLRRCNLPVPAASL